MKMVVTKGAKGQKREQKGLERVKKRMEGLMEGIRLRSPPTKETLGLEEQYRAARNLRRNFEHRQPVPLSVL